MSLRIIATTIILLWSIQTYKCNEGFKPGKKNLFLNFHFSPVYGRCDVYGKKRKKLFRFIRSNHSESFQVVYKQCSKLLFFKFLPSCFTNHQNRSLVGRTQQSCSLHMKNFFVISILISSNLKCVIRNLFHSICIFVL